MLKTTFSEYISLLFIDRSVDDYSHLLAGTHPGIKTHLLNLNEDGIHQITRLLETQYSENVVQAIHIVAHGSPGSLSLGNTQLSRDTLARYTQELQTWGSNSKFKIQN